jgi:hypothetical protein
MISQEQTEAVLDRCALHLSAATNRGFSQEAAEEMAVTLHSVLLAELLGAEAQPL